MDDLNGECYEHHEFHFPSISASDSEHEYMKEFLLEPNKPARNDYNNEVLPASNQQHVQSNMLYGNNMMGTPGNCYESNGRVDNMLPMGIHDPNALPNPLVTHMDCSRTFMPNASPGGIGMQVSQQMPVLPMSMASASPSGMGMPVPSPGMNMAVPSPGMGMPVPSPGSMVMGVPSPSGMGMPVPVNSSRSPYNPSPNVMGMPSPSTMTGVSPSPMGIPSVSPGSLGMSNASPSGMPIPSASPSGRVLPNASPNLLNMSSTSVGVAGGVTGGNAGASARSPLTAGPSRSPYRSSPSHFSVASPSALGLPSSSPSRLSMPNVSPGRVNLASASPGRATISSASPGQVSVPGTSPSHVSMPSTSPGRLSMMSSSPMVTDHGDMNGASYSASCSSSSSPAGVERGGERVSATSGTGADPSQAATAARTNESSVPSASTASVEEDDEQDSEGSEKDVSQVRKVRRKTKSKTDAQVKKRKDVRAQVMLADIKQAIASSLYEVLPRDVPGTASNDDDLAAGYGTVKSTRGRKRRYDGPSKGPSKREPVTYLSQISSQNGIKLRIKKTTPARKAPKQRNRKRRPKNEDTDSEEEGVLSAHRRSNSSSWSSWSRADQVADDQVQEQSKWGDSMPVEVLHSIFKMVTHEEGCVPFLVRMTRVCKLWRLVAISPDLWHTIELSSTWVRDRVKNLHTFRWLCENRLTNVRDLNLGGWKFSGIPSLLDVIANNCVALRGLNLTGWQGLHMDDMSFLVTNCQLLERIDLSTVNPEAHNNKGAVSLNSLQNLTQIMGARLTHLVLANNKLAGVPQITSSIATYCPNLQVLDMSNVRTVAHATAQLHIERLQAGCPKLRVLRITNSQFALAPATIAEQIQSPGFPELEELSVASAARRTDLASPQPFIDDDALGRILKSSLKLRLLDVRGTNRITDSSLVRIPAWDLEHLYLSGCHATRLPGSGLELITQKWGHSLIELDLGWSSATQALDMAVQALADKGAESPLRILNLCGSSVSLEPVKAVLVKCHQLCSLNLASCRALPRGMKRNYEGIELVELRSTFEDKAPSPEPEPEPEPREQSPEKESPRPTRTYATTEQESDGDDDDEEEEMKSEAEVPMETQQQTTETENEENALKVRRESDGGGSEAIANQMTPVIESINTPDAAQETVPGSSTPGTPGPSGTPGTPGLSGTPGTPSTPGTSVTPSGGDSELLALAQDVKCNLDNHMGYSSFSELDCGSVLP